MGQLLSSLALHLDFRKERIMEKTTSFVFQNALSQRCSHTHMRPTVWKQWLFWSEIQLNILLGYLIINDSVICLYSEEKCKRNSAVCDLSIFLPCLTYWLHLGLPDLTKSNINQCLIFPTSLIIFPVYLVSHIFWKFKRPITCSLIVYDLVLMAFWMIKFGVSHSIHTPDK